MNIKNMEEAQKLYGEYNSLKKKLNSIEATRECKYDVTVSSLWMNITLPTDLSDMVINDIEQYYRDKISDIEKKFEEF